MAENNNGLDPAFHHKAWTICHDYLGQPWKEIPEKEFIVETLPGGLSNYLYICTVPDKYVVKGGFMDMDRLLLVHYLVGKEQTEL